MNEEIPSKHFDRDTRHVWCKEAEQYLVQLVKDTDRDENWAAVARAINLQSFKYCQCNEYGLHEEHLLHVEPEHCRLYYDRQISHKYPRDYCKPRYPEVTVLLFSPVVIVIVIIVTTVMVVLVVIVVIVV